eukprot:jgi/Mesvir1/4374/Mv19753-RA.1
MNPDLEGKGYAVDTGALVRVRKRDLKINGPELMRCLSNGTKSFFDFLADDGVLEYIRQTGLRGESNSLYMAKINGNSKRLSKNVIDLCDEQAVDTCPVWIHCLLAQKLGEWIEGICLVFAMNLVEKIAKNNADKVANDPLRDVLYHKGLEPAAGTSKSHAKGECTDSRETTKLVWGKREAEPRPEDSGRSTKARMDNKVDELKLAEIEKQHEFRMREMQHQFDINIREMDRAALYRNTLVDDDSRLKRFRHMFQMIQVLADAESGAGPVCVDEDEADRCNIVFKNVFFDAFIGGETFVASSHAN